MERGEHGAPWKSRNKRCLVFIVVAVLLLIVIIAIVLGLTLKSTDTTFTAKFESTDKFKSTFTARCEQFGGYDCEKVWGAFEKAYVGRDPCEVPPGAYDPFIAAAPLKPACNRMMFWSKTKDVVHDFTQKKDCFITVEDTLMGHVLDGLTWCGKEGSSETFTTDCPGWAKCENNAVRSFWNRVSAAFADAACGDVSAMLNGSISTPFHPASIFASIEVKRLNPSAVKSLSVVLVTQKSTVANCASASLQDLQKELAEGIKYNCKEVAETQIKDCGSDPEIACGACW